MLVSRPPRNYLISILRGGGLFPAISIRFVKKIEMCDLRRFTQCGEKAKGNRIKGPRDLTRSWSWSVRCSLF